MDPKLDADPEACVLSRRKTGAKLVDKLKKRDVLGVVLPHRLACGPCAGPGRGTVHGCAGPGPVFDILTGSCHHAGCARRAAQRHVPGK